MASPFLPLLIVLVFTSEGVIAVAWPSRHEALLDNRTKNDHIRFL